MSRVSGHGNGKVILLGEHAVVYGVPAIAAGLEAGASARVVDGETELRIAPWGVIVRPDDPSPLGGAFAALLEARAHDAIDGARARDHALEAHVTLPGSAGLGSSAALGVAVLRALDEMDAIDRDFDRCQSIALAWERVFHGNPSGIDTALALAGGLARYVRHPAAGEPALRPIHEGGSFTLVVAHSGQPGSTKETVAGVASRRAADPERFERTLASFRDVVAAGEAALRASDLSALGASFDRCHALLAAWGVSTPVLDAMCARAVEAGALGAKLTGGGGGGCMIALVEPRSRAAVRDALASMGRETFETTIGPSRPTHTERA